MPVEASGDEIVVQTAETSGAEAPQSLSTAEAPNDCINQGVHTAAPDELGNK